MAQWLGEEGSRLERAVALRDRAPLMYFVLSTCCPDGPAVVQAARYPVAPSVVPALGIPGPRLSVAGLVGQCRTSRPCCASEIDELGRPRRIRVSFPTLGNWASGSAADCLHRSLLGRCHARAKTFSRCRRLIAELPIDYNGGMAQKENARPAWRAVCPTCGWRATTVRQTRQNAEHDANAHSNAHRGHKATTVRE
jgi:hypothetical protein